LIDHESLTCCPRHDGYFHLGLYRSQQQQQLSGSLHRPGVLRPSFQSVGIRSCPGGVTMLFGNLFGGGAYAQKIDYSTLDFPGPEIATATQEGKVLVTSPAKPHLAVATFAGGCFCDRFKRCCYMYTYAY
jgi:hypothetical protein